WNNGLPLNAVPPDCKGLQFDLMNGQTDEMQKHNGQTLSNFAAANAAALRLAPKVDKQPQAFSFHPLIRTNDGFAAVQIVTELIQRKDVLLDPKNPASAKIRMYGGSTVHFD